MSEDNSNEDRPRYVSDARAYDIDLNALNAQQKQTWQLQEAYLAAYAGRGTKATTASRVGVGRTTVHYWERDNYLNFNERFSDASEHFCNVLEDHALQIALGTKPGQSPLMMITLLNANMPEKYRPNVQVHDDSESKKILQTLQQIRKTSSQPTADEPQPENVSNISRMAHKR